MKSPFEVVRNFEAAVAEYTGAPYVVAVNSCTMAILLALAYMYKISTTRAVNIPKRTYVSVPMCAKHAGFAVRFRDEDWRGSYQIAPFPVYDSARFFTSGMYDQFSGGFACVSFHATKILGDTQGGAILHDSLAADAWFRRMRFDGRTEGVPPALDNFTEIGYHCYMSPDVAARLLHKIGVLPEHNAPLPNDLYPDLSQFKVFK